MPRPSRQDQINTAAEPGCDVAVVHLDAVVEARRELPSSEVVDGLAQTFAALADPTRVRIVAALSRRELCVCDLAATIGLTESAVSHQLRQLRGIGLVRSRREGRMAYYALDDAHVAAIFADALEHVRHGAMAPEATADVDEAPGGTTDNRSTDRAGARDARPRRAPVHGRAVGEVAR